MCGLKLLLLLMIVSVHTSDIKINITPCNKKLDALQ